MRVFFTALSLATAIQGVRAEPSNVKGLAGSIDNTAQAASLQSAASPPGQGSYHFRNAATGQTLTYTRDGNHIVPSAGEGTPVQILSFGAAVPWVRLQIGDKDKCLSAQWGGSYNLAGVMYACAVEAGGEITRIDNTLESTKQWWLMVPVTDYVGDATTSTHVLLAAQAHSVATREKAQRGFARRRSLQTHTSSPSFARIKRDASATSVAQVVPLASTDPSIPSDGAFSPPMDIRRPWRELAAEFLVEQAKGAVAAIALEAEQREAARVEATAAPAEKENIRLAAVADATTRTIAAAPDVVASTSVAGPVASSTVNEASSAEELPVDPVSLVKSDTAVAIDPPIVEADVNAAEAYEPAVSVKLNVAGVDGDDNSRSRSRNAYFIIPVDHLIDMHTLALTGHEITSYRAQSTALDLWDPEDTYQHWIVESA